MIELDPGSTEPPFEQIRSQVAALVAGGRLRAGDRMPTVRALAGKLGLAVNTVARAYKELEALGVVETRGRAGTYVAGRGVERSVRTAAGTYVEAVRALGLSDADAVDAVRRALGS